MPDGDEKRRLRWSVVGSFSIRCVARNRSECLLGMLARGVYVLRRRRRILVAYEKAHAGEVLGPVRELRRAAVSEVVGTDALDLPRREFAGFVGAPRRFEELRAEIVHAEDEADVRT